MNKRVFLFSGIILCNFFSCSSNHKKEEHIIVSDSLKSIPVPPNDKTLEVNKPCIVLLWPDSNEMDRMKTADSDAFYTTVDDYTFYTSQVMTLADSLKIANLSTDKKNLDFKTTDNKHIIIDLTKLKDEDAAWGAYLFNGIDTPKQTGSIDIDRAFLEKFFKK